MIELRTFGGCDLRGRGDGTGLRAILGQPRRLSLLVYLAVANPRGFHQRDTLLGLFWADFEQTRARAALRRALYFLRTRLGQGVLVRRGDEAVGLDPDRFWCDTWALAEALKAGRAEEALEIYVGEFLPGFFVSGAPAFEEWLDLERAALRWGARTAANGLANEAETAGMRLAAAGWLRRSLEIAPDDEPTVRRLMKLLASAGDRAGAMRVFEALERRLEKDLDTEPASDTRDLANRLRTTETRERPRPGRGVEGRPRRPEPAAYDLYVRGLETVERDREGTEAAIERYREAIRLDPAFAEAHSALATAYAHRVELFGASRNLSRIAIRLARRAIAIDPELPSAHLALGQNLETLRRLTDATKAYRRAVELDPGFAPAMWALAQISTWAGDFDEAIVVAERALDLMPGDPRPCLALGLAYYCLDWPSEAEAWYERALSIWPGFAWGLASLAYFRLMWGRPGDASPLLDRILDEDPDSWIGLTCSGEFALFSGDPEQARNTLEQAFSRDPDGRHTGHLRSVAIYLAQALSEVGEPELSRDVLAHAEAINVRAVSEGTEFGGYSVDLAAVHALRGEPEAARSWLTRASDREGWRQYRFAAVDPTLGALRREPWFSTCLDQMKADVALQRERTATRADRVAPL